MNQRIIIPIIALSLIFTSCNGQEAVEDQQELSAEAIQVESKKSEPHKYGGWYCPDNFGFVPVDINNLNEVPAISNRLPTQEELDDHMSLIKVDTDKYPSARALEIDLPRVAKVRSDHSKMNELVIIIQAIVIDEDTIVGYRFQNGGNGSAWMRDVTFLSNEEVEAMGPQPFFYSTSTLNASKEDILKAIGSTDYGKELAVKFDREDLFVSEWYYDSWPHVKFEDDKEMVNGYLGVVFGNLYFQIDYDQNGLHYSEKMLIMENDDNTTQFFFASGPYPEDFEKQNTQWENWFASIVGKSEGR